MDYWDLKMFVQEFRAGIYLYRTLLDKHVYPPFTDPNRAAMEEANRVWSQWMSEPYSGHEPGDLADAAHDHALDVYNELFAMQTILMNLFAAGVSHLFEQQLASMLHHDHAAVGKNVRGVFQSWAKAKCAIDVEHYPGWKGIEELALVANVAKHAEGRSEKELKARRPDLFGHPMLREPAYEDLLPTHFMPTRMPLGGSDLYVTKSDFEHYARLLDEFWKWFIVQAGGESEDVQASD